MSNYLPNWGSLALAMVTVLSIFFGSGARAARAQTLFPAYMAGLQIANLSSTSAAVVSITAYNADGSQNGVPFADTIAANSSKSYFPVSNVSSGFAGSVVVRSNSGVAGLVNVLAMGNGTYPAGAAYIGSYADGFRVAMPIVARGAANLASVTETANATAVDVSSATLLDSPVRIVAPSPEIQSGAAPMARSQTGTTVLLPLLSKNNGGFTTWYSIQNTGTTSATVNITYSDGTVAGPFVIPQSAAKIVYQSLEQHLLPVFAAKITGDQPLAAAVIQESNKIMFAYSGMSAGSTDLFFPLINANNAGYVTGLQIQNTGSDATIITVKYTSATGGPSCTEAKIIPAGTSSTFALDAFNPGKPADVTSDCAKTAFVGSARVVGNTTNQPLVGIGNQLKPGVNGEAYNAFSSADAGKRIVLPLIMDRNAGFFTGFNVQNVGTSATNVLCVFQNNTRVVSKTLQPGEAMNDLQNGQLGDRYVGSAICTGDAADSKLVAVVNEVKSSAEDNLLVYEGVKP